MVEPLGAAEFSGLLSSGLSGFFPGLATKWEFSWDQSLGKQSKGASPDPLILPLEGRTAGSLGSPDRSDPETGAP